MFVYPSTLFLPPLLALNTPFPLYLSTPVALQSRLHPSTFTSSEMLLSMAKVAKVDEADGSFHTSE